MADVLVRAPDAKSVILPLPGDLVSSWLREESMLSASIALHDVLCTFLHWDLNLDFRMLHDGQDLLDESCMQDFCKSVQAGRMCCIQVLLRLLGGKGGFGALLKKQGRGKKTTDFDSSRDLSGRRLRHSKAVERIKEWMKKQKSEDELVRALQGEGPELPKPTPDDEKLDADFMQKLARNSTDRSAAVKAGMKLLDTSADPVEEPPAKRPRVAEATASSSAAGSSASSTASTGGEASTSVKKLGGGYFDALDTLGSLSSEEEDKQA
mmetsp:Transcript_62158/g.115343  ORF Transcript_62158/g.115343 Transcript_62158/m.115343 type:complete len:266 (-) Transcript_62158:99-896(-)